MFISVGANKYRQHVSRKKFIFSYRLVAQKQAQCTYSVMAAIRIDGERNGIAFEMFARERRAGAADVLIVETGALIVLQAHGGTVKE